MPLNVGTLLVWVTLGSSAPPPEPDLNDTPASGVAAGRSRRIRRCRGRLRDRAEGVERGREPVLISCIPTAGGCLRFVDPRAEVHADGPLRVIGASERNLGARSSHGVLGDIKRANRSVEHVGEGLGPAR